jgi:UDP-N-acetylmuramoyl-L-alanyl-D-glutamate--2,6-diaminopimelate ligase
MNLDVLLGGIGQIFRNGVNVPATGVSCDTRRLSGGEVFVAVPGVATDGHGFVWEAVSRGAGAVVAERVVPTPRAVPYVVVEDARRAFAELAGRFYQHPSLRLNLVGVTGTNGKTTTTYILRSIFQAAGEKVGLIGTVEYGIGPERMPSSATTPAADFLNHLLSEMVGRGCRTAVMEVSSHALDQHRVHGLRFAAGVFTNLTRDHLDYHKTLADYRAAKQRLFEMLPEKGVAAANLDDPSAEFMLKATKARPVGFGLRRRAPVSVRAAQCGIEGTRFELRLGNETVRARTKLLGRHNLYNIAAAAAAAWGMGYDPDPIRAGIEAMEQVPGRLERVDESGGPLVVVDYAHTDDALEKVLLTLQPLTRGRLILVFGCGGDRDTGKRPRMGRVAERLADVTLLTSDNPRSEDPLTIIRQIQGGMSDTSRYHVEPDREAAIRKAVALAGEGDVVLIAGKGHETVQHFKDGSRHFDDRETARRYLRRAARS